MPRAFGTTPHSVVIHAVEAESRQHTYIEQNADGSYSKKYELRVLPEKLLVMLDALAANSNVLAARQLRGEILATLGLYEEG